MTTAAVILAAGAGTRMGGVAKALLRRGDRTFLACIVDTARADEVVVVVGPPYGDEVAAHARALGARVVRNPDPARGMASSINLGFADLVRAASPATASTPGADAAREVDAAWLWPVDHPDVQPSTLAALRAALATHEVARPVCDGRGGHPPLVARALFARLAACTSARDVIKSADVVDVRVGDRGTIEDVDR